MQDAQSVVDVEKSENGCVGGYLLSSPWHQNVNNQSSPERQQSVISPTAYHPMTGSNHAPIALPHACWLSQPTRQGNYIYTYMYYMHTLYICGLGSWGKAATADPLIRGENDKQNTKKLALTLRFQTRIIAHASSPTFWISSASCCAHQASRRRSSVAIIRDLLTVILVHVVFVAKETSGECVLAQTCVTRNTALSHWRRLCGPVTANTRAHPHTECINQWLWVERCIASYCWNCCVEDLGLGWDWGVTTVGKDLCLLTVALC